MYDERNQAPADALELEGSADTLNPGERGDPDRLQKKRPSWAWAATKGHSDWMDSYASFAHHE